MPLGGTHIDISTSDASGWLLVQPSGDIDIATADALNGSLAEDRNIILDLTEVGFMDSTGLRTLVAVHNRLTKVGHRLRIVVPSGPVERVIAITGLTDALDTVLTLNDAVSAP